MTAVLALTARGAALGAKLQRKLGSMAHLYVPVRYRQEYRDCFYLESSLSETIKSIWSNYRRFVFIMAAGIVVRTIAPLLVSKSQDPAVVVLDEQGEHVIALLSGHLGGANALAREIAGLLQARPVITTATDVEGIPALDDLARRYGWKLEKQENWKRVALDILENKRVAFYSSVVNDLEFPDNVTCLENLPDEGAAGGAAGQGTVLERIKACSSALYITERAELPGEAAALPYVLLRPKNLVVGLGCRRGTAKEAVLKAIEEMLAGLNLNLSCISHLATMELKKDEPGLLSAAAQLGVPLRWVTREEIRRVAAAGVSFKCSPFVEAQVGVGAVAEPAAWLTAKKPRLLAGKTRFPGITAAVVKDLAVQVTECETSKRGSQ